MRTDVCSLWDTAGLKTHYVLLSNNIFIGSRLCEHSGWELASTKPREARAHRGKQGQWRLLKVYFSHPWVYLYLENNPEKIWHNVTFYFFSCTWSLSRGGCVTLWCCKGAAGSSLLLPLSLLLMRAHVWWPSNNGCCHTLFTAAPNWNKVKIQSVSSSNVPGPRL